MKLIITIDALNVFYNSINLKFRKPTIEELIEYFTNQNKIDKNMKNEHVVVDPGHSLSLPDSNEIKIPTCGRMVHYFSIDDGLKKENPAYCTKFPATVIEASDLHVNMVVSHLGNVTPNAVARLSVPHISVVPKNIDNIPTMSFWDWPQI